MYKLTLLLIPMILLSSCTIDWNDEKDKKITELNQKIENQKEEIKKTKDDDLFKKNKECQAYLKKMEDEEMSPESGFLENRIFYSEVVNSCIYQSIWTSISIKNITDICFMNRNILTNEKYDNICFRKKTATEDNKEIKQQKEKYDNLYENWKTLENFDKALQKLSTKSPN